MAMSRCHEVGGQHRARTALDLAGPLLSVVVIGLVVVSARAVSAAAVGDVIAVAMKSNAAAAAAQKRVDALSEETHELLTQYRAAQEQIESLNTYNAQVEKLTASQQEEMASLRQQIDQAALISREVTPLMLRMLDTLEQFVELDAPFLLEERRNRIQSLRRMMDRADVSDAEKYRRILEAYQVENEYGRTIEAYQGALTIAGAERTVSFLRLGRVALMYQSLDGDDLGVWSQGQRDWQPLPTAYRSAIKKGLRIARKQAAPDLLRLPIAAAEEVQP